jgi:hypothetical protein
MQRDLRLKVIRQEVFSLDVVRFAGMLGTFVSTYKFLINAIPLLKSRTPPRESPFTDDEEDEDIEAAAALKGNTLTVPLANRKARLSLSKEAQAVLIRKKTRKWHAALAGAVAGGLAVMWESRSRRRDIAQQMFVRGLQGSYNSFTTKRGIKVPHGDVLVFSLA